MTALSSPPLVGIGRTRRFFPELESLRGIAVLLVFAAHAAQLSGGLAVAHVPSPLAAFIERPFLAQKARFASGLQREPIGTP